MTDLRTQLQTVADADVEQLVRKDAEYGSSWKKRGGTGIFHNLDRKWSRIEKQSEDHGWDILAAFTADSRPEGIADDIGDLRRYLMLLEAHLRSIVSIPIEQQPKSLAPLPAKRPNGFDVGNGLFREGDHAYYQGSKVKVMTIHQDGNVDVLILNTGVTASGIKWRFLVKDPPSKGTGQENPFGYTGEE